MQKPADMFDRDFEWIQLGLFAHDVRPGATLGVVSGRRRQGKTFLLRALCRATGGFYFAAPGRNRSQHIPRNTRAAAIRGLVRGSRRAAEPRPRRPGSGGHR